MTAFSKLRILYQNKLSVLGTVAILIGLYFFGPIATTHMSMLIPLKGTIKLTSSSEGMSSNKDKYGHETYSRFSTLAFSLNEFNKNFILSGGSSNPLYDGYTENDKIESYLKGSDKVIVWIKKWDENQVEPKVFRIDIDGKTEFSFETDRSNAQKILFFMLVFGCLCIYLGNKIEESKSK
jgi:hypothetical protein